MTAACRSLSAAPLGRAGAADIAVRLPEDFLLQSGEHLSRREIALRLHGDPGKPVVLAAGGVSANRKVADSGDEKGWWRDIAGPGSAIDHSKFCVIGFDFLPGAGETARTISTADQARALALALTAIGVERVFAFIGASYGGMVALAFAERYPARLERLCVISAADRPHPAATALRGVQRRIVAFAARAGEPREGVALARQLAMATYRTPKEFAERFQHAPGPRAGDPHPVCDYLIARGRAFDMPAERYMTLSDSIDRHAVDAEKIAAPALFIASSGDWLVPLADMERLAKAARRSELRVIESDFGHDAFLKEAAIIGPLIRDFLAG